MNLKPTVLAGMILAGFFGTTAMGGGHADPAIVAAVKARQSAMTLYSFNLGLLGGMAKGQIEYDADAATRAAASLAALTQLDQSRMWPPGSDTESLGAEMTAALPKIWMAGSKAGEIGGQLKEAAVAMEGAAGNGLDALRGAIGNVGKACGACHDGYRQPKN